MGYVGFCYQSDQRIEFLSQNAVPTRLVSRLRSLAWLLT